MSNDTVLSKDCYVGESEHIYNTMYRNKSALKPVPISWWEVHRRPIFKSSKFALVAALTLVLVIVACSFSIGYFINKSACDKSTRQHLTGPSGTQLPRFPNIVSAKDNGKETSTAVEHQKKTMATEMTTRTNETTTRTNVSNNTPAPPIKGLFLDKRSILSPFSSSFRSHRMKRSVNLEGRVFQIHAKQNNQFWHFDGGHQVLKVVSSLWQPNDDFVKFTFEKQTDGSYKIKSFAMPRYMYDGYGVHGARGVYLNGDDQTDDDHMRYSVTMETNGYYRIKTKATNRYVRLDHDKYVSSRFNIADDRSLFKLVEVQTVNLEGKVFQIHSKKNNQFWHFDGGHQVLKVVSSLWQPNDDFVKFTFEKQTDGSYKIKSFAMPRYMYDGYGVHGARGVYLNGDDQTDDDHMRYSVTMETNGYYRIKTKATNRYVRLDSDKYVSSRFNMADDRSLFKLVEMQRVNLEGKVFQIHAKETNQFWHFDGGHQVLKVVSSLWQPNDDFVKFTFEKQTDGSYKIKSVAMPRYMYDGYGVPGARGIYLNGDDQTDDDHMRYYVTMETQGFYRIKTKATNRYVRLDSDKYVSSRYDKADNRSLFKLVVV
ncbi:uncharacterized protein LOC132732071 isoform X2 [Ruditapes philippinarum]|uniref:uncharacterized protein LOC132732071 isoform X2 n=1 Tax=Ruditapes philippinarum TaxID=129788 RepID=UPI00295B88B8|nr:uncharacterized protein LOC132732071 isoform X2 [Ruditapes philippinarum]